MNGTTKHPRSFRRSPSNAISCSWSRLTFLASIVLLVYTKVFRFNSRFLTEFYNTNGEHTSIAMMPFGAIERHDEAMLNLPTSQESLPPIYWINMDLSEARRRAMQEMFLSLGIVDTHRVSALDVNQTLALWEQDRLVFHHNVSLEEKDGRPSNKKHIENIYEYQEAACLLSHLTAIQRAYQDGHDQALILEDDALLSHHFKNLWKPYVDRAPMDWQILQFATNNPNVVKQGVNLIDYFITWQPYHWSTRAYIINRAGMQTIMDELHSLSPTGEDIWRIEKDPIVVADEVLYYVIQEAYTSTGLWVDSLSFGSTIQSKNAHSNLTSLIGETAHQKALINMMREKTYKESLLILMNVRARDLEELHKELTWIRQDNHAVSQLHDTCVWEINIVLTDSALTEPFQQQSRNLPSNVHFQMSVSSEPFNKFAYLKIFVDEMRQYDLVLFKDNDQRLNGFPWRTFVQRKGNATVAGPLRQSRDEALLHSHSFPKRQWFQFHAAEAWTEDWNTQWSSKMFADVVPTEVPLLEMYFVLFDAKFASYFFDLVLTPEFLNQTSAWGPDLLWCSAAQEWDPSRASCYLIPVSSSHEDTRQIFKNSTDHKDGGFQMVTTFKENAKFGKWMQVPEKWTIVIGGHLLWQIERRCRRLLKLRMIFPFELQKCPQKVFQLVHRTDGRKNVWDEDTHVNYQKMNQVSRDYMNPWMQQLHRNATMRIGVQNRTRVAELVAAVKMNRYNSSGVTLRSNRTGVQYTSVAGANTHPVDSKRKSLDEFESRLEELRQARAARLANKGEADPQDELQRGSESANGL